MKAHRFVAFAALGLGALLMLAVIFPSVASAQFFDPTSTVSGDYNGWVSQAQGWARSIYLSLLVFEIIAIGLTAVLFRENVGELIGSVGFKIFIGGVYMWFVANAGAGGWPRAVIDTFKYFGVQLSGGGPNTTWLGAQGIGAAYLYFQAGDLSRKADAIAAQTANLPPNCTWIGFGDGYCDLAIINSAATQHAAFQLICGGLAVIIAFAVAAIFLQFILITIESYIVMGAGILFIGFAGSRFTTSFSQGYFSYMINVGVKLMVLYIVLGIEQQYMPTILATAGITLLSQSSVPFLGGAALGIAVVGAFQVVIAAGLVWALPGFASSFLTGQSSASGAAVLSQAVSSMAGASQALAQFSSASKAGSRIKELNSERSQMNAMGASNGQPTSGANASVMAPEHAGEAFATAGGRGAGGGAGANGVAGTNGASGTGGAAGGIGVTTGSGNGASRRGFGLESSGSATDATSSTLSSINDRQLQSTGTASNGNAAFNAPLQDAALRSSRQPLPSVSRSTSSLDGVSGGSESDSPQSSNVSVPINTQTGQNMMGSSQTGPRSSNGSIGFGEMHSNDIRSITSRAEATRLASATDWKDLDRESKDAIMSNSYARDAMRERLESSEREAHRDEDFANAYMLNGLAQAAPREIGQPTAVQVRISNPDKL